MCQANRERRGHYLLDRSVGRCHLTHGSNETRCDNFTVDVQENLHFLFRHSEPFSVPLASLPVLINTPSTYLSPNKRGTGKLQHETWKWFPHGNDRLMTSIRSSGEVTLSLDSLGINYVITEQEQQGRQPKISKMDQNFQEKKGFSEVLTRHIVWPLLRNANVVSAQYVNVSECFKEDSEVGRLLLDWLTQTSNVSAHPKMRLIVLDFFLRNSSSVGDKILFSTANAAIVARKNTEVNKRVNV
ncbi:hypothetical protein Bbelb_081020 [Branchiostoma belcheri]|nr:hypothetical protein Bbelb_081020 [Branchiostoma belcheri]